MYCSKCRRELYYKDTESKGWCFGCSQIVGVTNCKVSHWNLIAVLTMLWNLQVGI